MILLFNIFPLSINFKKKTKLITVLFFSCYSESVQLSNSMIYILIWLQCLIRRTISTILIQKLSLINTYLVILQLSRFLPYRFQWNFTNSILRYVKIDNKDWFVVTFKSVIFGFSNRGISTQNLIYNDFNIRKITAQDVNDFAKLTGDINPIHLDSNYAKQTRYGKCIVHGTFIQGLLSCLLGVHFPGTGCVLHAINCKFPEPLFVDETCRIEALVSKLRGRLATFDVNAYAYERNAVNFYFIFSHYFALKTIK
ncbi:unnamed protein product [Schistosoma intercalatum]|nr:unnamed protein product [Schistosoma intercalatum]